MSVLRVIDKSGDTAYEWDLSDQETVASIEKKFNKIIAGGYMAFRVDSPTSGEVIRDFDPQADTIIMTVPMVGG